MINLEIDWDLEAEKEFQDLSYKAQEKVRKEIEKLPEKGLKWEKVGPVFKPEIDLEAYRIKVDPEDKEGINHRIIFDVKDQKYIIYKVGRRPGFYEKRNLKEIKDRK